MVNMGGQAPGQSGGSNLSFSQSQQALGHSNGLTLQQLQAMGGTPLGKTSPDQPAPAAPQNPMNANGSAIVPTPGGGMLSNLISNIKAVPGQIKNAALTLANKTTAPGSGLNEAVNVGSDILATDENLTEGLTGQQSIDQTIRTGENIPEPNPLQAAQAGAEIAGVVTPDSLAEQGAADMTKNAAAKSTQTIQDMLVPNLSSKEGQTALAQGRVTEGKTSLLWGKQPDVVSPSDEIVKQAATVQKLIPGAENMSKPQMITTLKNTVSNTAKALEPAMKAVPITQATTGKAFDAWNAVKESQLADPDAEFAGSMGGTQKFQKQFETYLNKLQWNIQDPETGLMQSPDPKSLNDGWEVRKDYDASVPSNVKNATTASSDSLQWKKSMWLQNRSILSSMINDSSAGLGGTSKQAFSDMSDMYSARETLIKNTKIDTKGESGLLPQTQKDWAKWGIGLGIGTAVTLGAPEAFNKLKEVL